MATYKQDMPPSGGYAGIDFLRRVKPRWVKGKYFFPLFTIYTTLGLCLHKWWYYRNVQAPELENREAHIAMQPIILAERNREYLKQLVRNREYEKDIMKDYPGWIPGTYFGTPVYYRKGLWVDPSLDEYYVHFDYDKGYYGDLVERHYH